MITGRNLRKAPIEHPGRVCLAEDGKDYYIKTNNSDYEAERLIDSLMF